MSHPTELAKCICGKRYYDKNSFFFHFTTEHNDIDLEEDALKVIGIMEEFQNSDFEGLTEEAMSNLLMKVFEDSKEVIGLMSNFVKVLADPNHKQPNKEVTMTRAKFKCTAVTKCVGWGENPFTYAANMQPVTSGSDENKAFFAATPNGKIEISTLKEDLFEVGAEYYVDFTKA